MKRIAELDGTPVVGETYLVPVLYLVGGLIPRGVPVIGVVHNDKDIGAPDLDHVHIDVRFAADDDLTNNGCLSFTRGDIERQKMCPDADALVVGLPGDSSQLLLVDEEPRTCVRSHFPQQWNDACVPRDRDASMPPAKRVGWSPRGRSSACTVACAHTRGHAWGASLVTAAGSSARPTEWSSTRVPAKSWFPDRMVLRGRGGGLRRPLRLAEPGDHAQLGV